jgi:hypothetical protein
LQAKQGGGAALRYVGEGAFAEHVVVGRHPAPFPAGDSEQDTQHDVDIDEDGQPLRVASQGPIARSAIRLPMQQNPTTAMMS